MTSQIDRLWGKALDQAMPDTYTNLTWTQVKKIKQVFAELIVRECVDIVSKVPNGYRDYRNQIEDAMRADCLQAIQEHFGVE